MTFHRREMSQQPPSKLRACASALIFVLTFVSASFAHADVTFTVNTEADEPDGTNFDGICESPHGDCSLRAAIMQANGLTGPRTTHIVLPAGNYTLTRPAVVFDESVGDLNLESPLSPDQFISIEGASAASSVIDADQIDRVMTIERDRVVTISNVTIRGGYLTSDGGGGIKLDGTLTLQDSIVSGNSSGFGAGISVSRLGNLDVLRTTFVNNVAATSGGAVFVEGTATFLETSMTGNSSAKGGAAFISAMGSTVQGRATFRESSITGNYSGDGGAIYVGASLELINSTISGNAAARDGGGIWNFGQSSIVNSTVSGNTASRDGGGISNFGQSTVANSTISGNAANGDGGGTYNFGQTFVINSTISGNTTNANGGGIANEDGATWLYNSSIIANDASHDRNPPGGSGGGLYNKPGKRLVATNSLIAANTTLDSPIADDCNGVLEVYGWNLLADYAGCSFSGNGIGARGLVSTNTIGPLADNGGPTLTHALLAGSEAIDSTTAQGCVDDNLALLTTDQRGAPRIAGAKCDVGAYEFGSVVPVTDRIFRNGFD